MMAWSPEARAAAEQAKFNDGEAGGYHAANDPARWGDDGRDNAGNKTNRYGSDGRFDDGEPAVAHQAGTNRIPRR